MAEPVCGCYSSDTIIRSPALPSAGLNYGAHRLDHDVIGLSRPASFRSEIKLLADPHHLCQRDSAAAWRGGAVDVVSAVLELDRSSDAGTIFVDIHFRFPSFNKNCDRNPCSTVYLEFSVP